MPDNLRAEIYNINNTEISTWFERDRKHISLKSKTGRELIEWWDDAVDDAVESGELDTSESVLGDIDRFVKQGGALHQSALAAYIGRSQ